MNNSFVVNESTIGVTNRNHVTKRSRDPSPLQLDNIDLTKEETIGQNKLSLTLNSPLSIKKINSNRAHSSLSRRISNINIDHFNQEKQTLLASNLELIDKNRKIKSIFLY